MRRSRKGFAAAAALVVVGSLTAAGAGAREVSGDDIRLELGHPVYWTGEITHEYRWEDQVLNPPQCNEDPFNDRCRDYPLRLPADGGELRVALDTPSCDDELLLQLIDPSGTVVEQGSSCYSIELAAPATQGRWIARVAPVHTSGVPYRMRARWAAGAVFDPRAVEAGDPDASARDLLPNLVAEPPHRFTFFLPEPEDGLPQQSLGGSCWLSEEVEDGADRCLRFAVGARNVGPGPLELRYSKTNPAPEITQTIYRSDGSSRTTSAGDASMHPYHRHFHVTEFASIDVFMVSPRDRRLYKVDARKKFGFCLSDYKIVGWTRFASLPTYQRGGCESSGEPVFGLSSGYADIYGEGIAGSYVDGSRLEGYLLLRVRVDAADQLKETNERDNVGYAYVEVNGDDVRLIERGLGRSPWDPHATVLRDWWEAR